MDALKKAEFEKRQGQPASAGVPQGEAHPPGLALEPIPATSADLLSIAAMPGSEMSPEPSRLPGLMSHLEELDAQFLEEAQQAAVARLKPQAVSVAIHESSTAKLAEPPPAVPDLPPRTTAKPEPRSAMAERTEPPGKTGSQTLFAAKQAGKPPMQKNVAFAVGAFALLSVAGIGGTAWWQLQPKSVLLAGRMPPPSATAPVAPPIAVPPAPTLAAPAPQTAFPAPSSAQAESARGDDDGKSASGPAVASTNARPARAKATTATTATAVLTESEDRPVRVTKAPPRVDPALIRGFDAFNRGELALAQLEYEHARKSDPRNSDALHGLAAIALRQGRYDQADMLYRQIIEADPQDAVAIAALINSRGQIDPNAAESRLKSLAAEQPELSAPHFSLGNLYARHGRWSEAQQAYFRAYSAEPDNPDILYNLAISLEHLRQNRLAAQYYGLAIAATRNRPASFDTIRTSARLQSLLP